MKYIFEKIIPTESDWNIIENSVDSSCFHTKKWADFVCSIGLHLFYVKVSNEFETIAYFIGQKISLGFLSILASPFDGCGYTQGLCFSNKVSRQERVSVYVQLSDWIFSNRYASMLQVDDWQLREDRDVWVPNDQVRIQELETRKLHYDLRPTLYVDLNKTEEELWSGLHYKTCKYCINKANKLGLKVEYITKREDIEKFCDIHYSHLFAVCRSKGMKPRISQSYERMVKLCYSLFPDKVLMVKVLGLVGGVEQVMSSAIFCLDKGECIYWTGASYKEYQKYCPNELMVWEAMKKISTMGGGDLNFGGIASYKLKFGTKYAYVPKIFFQKYPGIYEAKAFAKRCISFVRSTTASIRKSKIWNMFR